MAPLKFPGGTCSLKRNELPSAFQTGFKLSGAAHGDSTGFGMPAGLSEHLMGDKIDVSPPLPEGFTYGKLTRMFGGGAAGATFNPGAIGSMAKLPGQHFNPSAGLASHAKLPGGHPMSKLPGQSKLPGSSKFGSSYKPSSKLPGQSKFDTNA